MIALTFIGESLFKTVDFPLGLKVCNFLKTNFSATMILAFILNTMAQQLVATGAFEIVINDETVFSKLETGRLVSSLYKDVHTCPHVCGVCVCVCVCVCGVYTYIQPSWGSG